MCRHEQTEYGRVVGRDGRAQFEERCCACKVNVRGVGVWVPRSEVRTRCPVTPEDLPVFRDLRTPEDKGEQPLLFG
jgi:hypothetical protein